MEKQRPHVMTIEEVEDALDTVIWVDRPLFSNSSDMYALIMSYSRKHGVVTLRFIDMFPDESVKYLYSRYGIDWRCWDKRPTDEERKAWPCNPKEETESTETQ